MSPLQPELPTLTINRDFIQEFIAAEKGCCALGMVEIHNRLCGLLALRPDVEIPQEISAIGFNFGHSLLGNDTYEVVHFSFEFYGFKTYHVLINPNNQIAQTVLQRMIESHDFFFFALEGQNSSVTAYRSNLSQDILLNLTTGWERIQNSTTTDRQYRKALFQFAEHLQPQDTLLNWECRDNFNYLDLSQNRLELPPV